MSDVNFVQSATWGYRIADDTLVFTAPIEVTADTLLGMIAHGRRGSKRITLDAESRALLLDVQRAELLDRLKKLIALAEAPPMTPWPRLTRWWRAQRIVPTFVRKCYACGHLWEEPGYAPLFDGANSEDCPNCQAVKRMVLKVQQEALRTEYDTQTQRGSP